MNKKVFILIIVVVLLLIVGGVFWWLGKEKEGEVRGVTFESPENYIIKDTPEGKIVENKNAGLSFKVPEGWGVEIEEYTEGEGTVEVFTSDISYPPNTKLQEKGCGIAINIEYEGIQSLDNLIKDIQENPDDSKYKEIIDIAGYKALKQITFNRPEMGQGISIRAPIDNKIYIFSTFLPTREKERCERDFDNFLGTISIK